MQNLGNEQQLNMAELQIEAQVEGANQAAVNQERMLNNVTKELQTSVPQEQQSEIDSLVDESIGTETEEMEEPKGLMARRSV